MRSQAHEARALQQTLAGMNVDDAIRAELVQLGVNFEAIEEEITRRIEPQDGPCCDNDEPLSPSEQT